MARFTFFSLPVICMAPSRSVTARRTRRKARRWMSSYSACMRRSASAAGREALLGCNGLPELAPFSKKDCSFRAAFVL